MPFHVIDSSPNFVGLMKSYSTIKNKWMQSNVYFDTKIQVFT